MLSKRIDNKNAFRWDAYRPLVYPSMHCAGDVYPSMHCRGWGCVSKYALGRGCLPRGLPAQGMYLPRVCTCPGVYLPRGCTCPRGVPALGVYLLSRVCIPACNWADTPTLWTDRPLRKHNLHKLRLRVVKKLQMLSGGGAAWLTTEEESDRISMK